MKPTIYTLTGPSGVGKSTLISQAEARSAARQACSVTTRALRDADDRRIPVTMDTFLEMEQSGQLIESIFYDGNAYGISRSVVLRILEEGRPALLDCNESGVKQTIASGVAPVTTIFLVADAQTLYERQMSRGAGTLSSRIRRLKQALEEIDGIDSGLYHHVIRNDSLPDATAKLLGILNGEPVPSDPFDVDRFKRELGTLIDTLEASAAHL